MIPIRPWKNPPPRPPEQRLDVEAAFYDPVTVQRLMRAWASGCSVLEMSSAFAITPDEINRILDHFTPYY